MSTLTASLRSIFAQKPDRFERRRELIDLMRKDVEFAKKLEALKSDLAGRKTTQKYSEELSKLLDLHFEHTKRKTELVKDLVDEVEPS